MHRQMALGIGSCRNKKMNWKQLFASSHTKERDENLILFLKVIQARKQRLVFSRGRLVREKRGNFPGAHFLNDRRRLRPRLSRAITLTSFAFILTTVSVATWLFAMHAPAQLAAVALGLHITLLSLILYIKPYNYRLQTT